MTACKVEQMRFLLLNQRYIPEFQAYYAAFKAQQERRQKWVFDLMRFMRKKSARLSWLTSRCHRLQGRSGYNDMVAFLRSTKTKRQRNAASIAHGSEKIMKKIKIMAQQERRHK